MDNHKVVAFILFYYYLLFYFIIIQSYHILVGRVAQSV
jgi:hypothetical protein